MFVSSVLICKGSKSKRKTPHNVVVCREKIRPVHRLRRALRISHHLRAIKLYSNHNGIKTKAQNRVVAEESNHNPKFAVQMAIVSESADSMAPDFNPVPNFMRHLGHSNLFSMPAIHIAGSVTELPHLGHLNVLCNIKA